MGLLQDLRGLNAAYAEVHASMQEDQDKGYVVTAADKKGNTKAWQGYKSGVKSKTTGKPLYRAADHLKKEEANRESQLWDQVAANLTELHELRGVKYKVVLFNEDAQSDAVAQMSGDGGDPQDDAVKQVVKAGKKKRNVKTGRLEIPKESMQHRRNPEGSIKDRFKSRQTDPSKAGFTGIGDSIEDIMKQNAAMKKAAAKKTKKEELELTGKFTEQEIAAILEAERTIASRLERKRKLYDKTTKKAMRDAMETGEASGHNRYRMSSISREYDALKARRDKKEK